MISPVATTGPVFRILSACGQRSRSQKDVKVPPLDHLPAFMTACRSTLLKSCNEVATFPGILLLF